MNKLTFSFNHNNKLSTRAFSMIRVHVPGDYYIGKEFNIYLGKLWQGKVIVSFYNVITLSDIDERITYLNYGLCYSEGIKELERETGIKLHFNQPLDYVIFSFVP